MDSSLRLESELRWSYGLFACVKSAFGSEDLGDSRVSADPSSEARSDGTEAKPARKVWVTPTIEEAQATVVTELKSAANGETPFSKNGS